MSRARSVALVGLTPHPVEVEAIHGAPVGLEIVGMTEAASRETRVRVRSALAACGIIAGLNGTRVTLRSAAPLNGSQDLAVAVAVAECVGAIPEGSARRYVLLGALSLSGELRAVRGVLLSLRDDVAAIVPGACSGEAALLGEYPLVGERVRDHHPHVAGHLRDVLADLRGEKGGTEAAGPPMPWGDPPPDVPLQGSLADKLAEVAALVRSGAAPRGVLLVGPPSSGKTMLARRLAGAALAPLTRPEAIEIAEVHSVAGMLRERITRPFRAPHHTCSEAGLVGGGSPVRPGEVSLAHGGVLLLDEVTEFRRSVLESLGRVLRGGEALLRCVGSPARFPARPVVVAADCPCPCGRRGISGGRSLPCSCTAERIARHEARLAECMALLGIAVRVDVPAWGQS